MGGGAGGYPSGSAEVCQQPAQALATMLNDGSKGLKTSSASSSALGAGLLDGAADAAARSLPLDHQSFEPDVEDDIRPPATAFIESSAGERVSALQLFEKAETKATAEQARVSSRVVHLPPAAIPVAAC